MLLFEKRFSSQAEALDFKNIKTQLIPIGADTNNKINELQQFKELLGADNNAILVRPDGHIAWKGDLSASSELKKLEMIVSV